MVFSITQIIYAFRWYCILHSSSTNEWYWWRCFHARAKPIAMKNYSWTIAVAFKSHVITCLYSISKIGRSRCSHTFAMYVTFDRRLIKCSNEQQQYKIWKHRRNIRSFRQTSNGQQDAATPWIHSFTNLQAEQERSTISSWATSCSPHRIIIIIIYLCLIMQCGTASIVDSMKWVRAM